MNKKSYFITIIAMALTMGQVFSYSSQYAKKALLQDLQQQRDKIQQIIEKTKKNNDHLDPLLSKDLALSLTQHCIQNHSVITEKNANDCFEKSFDFIAKHSEIYIDPKSRFNDLIGILKNE